MDPDLAKKLAKQRQHGEYSEGGDHLQRTSPPENSSHLHPRQLRAVCPGCRQGVYSDQPRKNVSGTYYHSECDEIRPSTMHPLPFVPMPIRPSPMVAPMPMYLQPRELRPSPMVAPIPMYLDPQERTKLERRSAAQPLPSPSQGSSSKSFLGTAPASCLQKVYGVRKRIAVSHLRHSRCCSLMHVLCRCAGGHPFC